MCSLLVFRVVGFFFFFFFLYVISQKESNYLALSTLKVQTSVILLLGETQANSSQSS